MCEVPGSISSHANSKNRKTQEKKATPKAHQWVAGGPHPDSQGTDTALPRIKTPASPGTDLGFGFTVTLSVHKLIPAESAFR